MSFGDPGAQQHQLPPHLCSITTFPSFTPRNAPIHLPGRDLITNKTPKALTSSSLSLFTPSKQTASPGRQFGLGSLMSVWTSNRPKRSNSLATLMAISRTQHSSPSTQQGLEQHEEEMEEEEIDEEDELQDEEEGQKPRRTSSLKAARPSSPIESKNSRSEPSFEKGKRPTKAFPQAPSAASRRRLAFTKSKHLSLQERDNPPPMGFQPLGYPSPVVFTIDSDGDDEEEVEEEEDEDIVPKKQYDRLVLAAKERKPSTDTNAAVTIVNTFINQGMTSKGDIVRQQLIGNYDGSNSGSDDEVEMATASAKEQDSLQDHRPSLETPFVQIQPPTPVSLSSSLTSPFAAVTAVSAEDTTSVNLERDQGYDAR